MLRVKSGSLTNSHAKCFPDVSRIDQTSPSQVSNSKGAIYAYSPDKKSAPIGERSRSTGNLSSSQTGLRKKTGPKSPGARLGPRSYANKASSKKQGPAKIQDTLARTFLDQIYLEKEVEKLKIELSSQIDFTCMSAFKEFDVRDYCHMDLAEFTDTLLGFVGSNMFDRQ